jgi:hypothetical protein
VVADVWLVAGSQYVQAPIPVPLVTHAELIQQSVELHDPLRHRSCPPLHVVTPSGLADQSRRFVPMSHHWHVLSVFTVPFEYQLVPPMKHSVVSHVPLLHRPLGQAFPSPTFVPFLHVPVAHTSPVVHAFPSSHDALWRHW